MKKIFTTSLLLIISISATWAQSKLNRYDYKVDLTQIVDDRVYVELNTPKVSGSETVFYLPKIIPGTYAIADYGRYVSELKAFDRRGNLLPVEKADANSWKISNAQKLAKITYWVDDIMDSKVEGPRIYPMAATNIEENKNFVLNTPGFFGYLDSNTTSPIQLEVIRQNDFYGSTGLIALETGLPIPKLKHEVESQMGNKRLDRYRVENYDRLVDSPIMYAKPDTAVIRVANTEVLIGSYSPTGKIAATEIANTVREVLEAQVKYLGGKLPVDKYAFIFYFTDQPVNLFGALEHWYSSFYYMPEQTIDKMKQQLRDFAAHEFFHIVTPLNIHSKEIHTFGFNQPEMSKHLWLYEGVTEYFAGNVQVKYNLLTPEEYLKIINEKMVNADGFRNDVPFTDISKFTLDKYPDQYGNVYQKGALIGMCMDIKLRQLSKGEYGMQNLLADLSTKYGKNRPFEDESLFDEIEKITFPEIGEFFRKYVAGAEKLPYEEIFTIVGVNYQPEVFDQEYSLGFTSNAIRLSDVNGKKKLSIGNLDGLTPQGTNLGFQLGDILMKINNKDIPDLGPELGAFLDGTRQSLKEGEIIGYTVLRKDAEGSLQPIELKSPIAKITITKYHIISFDEKATPEQLEIRKAWLTAE